MTTVANAGAIVVAIPAANTLDLAFKPIIDFEYDVRSIQSGESNMNLRIVDLPPTKVAFLRYTGPYGPALSDFWRDTFIPWLQTHLLDGPTCYGVGLDDPTTTPPEQCRYDACVEVPDSFVANGTVQLTTLPGGRYAVADFRGHARDIGEAWMNMCGNRIPAQQLQFDARPSFERYVPGSRADPETGLFSCELCVAVR